MTPWQQATEWEQAWWGNCANTYNEETKQTLYAERMGLRWTGNTKTPWVIDLAGKSVIDIGGGPCSLLLKCENFSHAMVVDPCEFPAWVVARYQSARIEYLKACGEIAGGYAEVANREFSWDEAWVYNVLQHTQEPGTIAENARHEAKLVRVFEWIEQGVCPGHPHNLTRDNLDEWFGGIGKVERVNERGCVGLCYHGIFKGASNE